MGTLGQTTALCPVCRRTVPAKVITEADEVHFISFCREHGTHKRLVRRDVQAYLQAQRNVKPAWVPRASAGTRAAACPEGCGFCDRHEQHVCLPIIEITNRCDLSCPICLVDAGAGTGKTRAKPWDMTKDEFNRILDGLVRTEGQVDVLNLSGGEPLLHPELLDLLDAALSRPEIVRISVSTNGLRLLREPQLISKLTARKVIVSLQFDGFDDHAYTVLRGRKLLAEKLQILKLLQEADCTTSLTMTVAKGMNEDQLRPALNYLFSHDHVVSLMLQPLAFTGRAVRLKEHLKRITLPDVLQGIDAAAHPAVKAADFLPLPCSHPLCFSLAFFLTLNNGSPVSIRQLTEGDILEQALANRGIFGLDAEQHERIKQWVYELWSGPTASVPESAKALVALRGLLREFSCTCSRFDPRTAFLLTERRVKSVFIHAFQDAETFDLARARRCCNAYPQPDGRLLPVCVRNNRRCE